jgi:hypothetical protein
VTRFDASVLLWRAEFVSLQMRCTALSIARFMGLVVVTRKHDVSETGPVPALRLRGLLETALAVRDPAILSPVSTHGRKDVLAMPRATETPAPRLSLSFRSPIMSHIFVDSLASCPRFHVFP